MFTSHPTYDRYRTLKVTSPMMRGEDVYALQTALSKISRPNIVLDGILGSNTGTAIRDAQDALSIKADGLAGGGTQTSIAKRLAEQASVVPDLPEGLVFGQVSHESSCRLGNYTAVYENGSWDVGVAQRNTAVYDSKESFNAPFVIGFLSFYLRKYFDKFVGVTPERRRWELAVGAWNAPAFACWIARQEGAVSVSISETLRPSSNARALLESYMDSATAFMIL